MHGSHAKEHDADRPQIAYFKPLSSALERMKKILFAPFGFTKWLALGFTAWLASLCERGGAGNFGNIPRSRDSGYSELIEKIDATELVIIIVVAVVILLVAVIIALAAMWINSRGKFMFLDNVVHDHCEVKKPWREFRGRGNSLFWWRLGFASIAFVVFLVIAGLGALSAVPLFKGSGELLPLAVAGIAVAGLLMLAFMVVIGYINLFLVDFVVPLMYKHEARCMGAWRMFLPSLAGHFWHYVLWGLFRLLIGIVTAILILAVIVVTCCIAGCLLIIPYVGSVLLLPVSVFVRSLSVEYLRQFSPDFDVLPPPAGPPAEGARMQPLPAGPWYGAGPWRAG